MMIKKIVAGLFIVCISQLGFSQNFDTDKLDNYFNALDKNNKFMGSVSVAKNGKSIYSKSIGFSDIENKTKANKNSKYRIGSISKTFTAVLVLKAVENHRLKLSQTIDEFFPTIKNSAKITIKNLLNHRSGIHSFTDDVDYLSWNTFLKKENEMIEIITKGGSDFEPNSKAEYSNSNFVLLTYILEKAFKKNYPELLQTYILEPLKLKNTFFGSKINSKNNECNSYFFNGDWELEKETHTSIPLGAGGIVSTPSDLVKFSDALFNEEIINKESIALMQTIKEHYGIGLFEIPFYGKKGFGHTGGIDGFSSFFCYFPNEKISYALTSNGSNYNNNEISIAVLSAIFNKPYEIPEFSTYKVNSEELDKYLGIYSSNEILLKITVTKNKNILIAQATDQPSFALDMTSKDIFSFEKAGVILEFNPAKKTMLLKQGGTSITFTKEQK